ncbi:hypothetical protein Lal_00015238 [Lupinus albus]|nr:hypothetical protein Lal_00015238 [Lupinus albus]
MVRFVTPRILVFKIIVTVLEASLERELSRLGDKWQFWAVDILEAVAVELEKLSRTKPNTHRGVDLRKGKYVVLSDYAMIECKSQILKLEAVAVELEKLSRTKPNTHRGVDLRKGKYVVLSDYAMIECKSQFERRTDQVSSLANREPNDPTHSGIEKWQNSRVSEARKRPGWSRFWTILAWASQARLSKLGLARGELPLAWASYTAPRCPVFPALGA